MPFHEAWQEPVERWPHSKSVGVPYRGDRRRLVWVDFRSGVNLPSFGSCGGRLQECETEGLAAVFKGRMKSRMFLPALESAPTREGSHLAKLRLVQRARSHRESKAGAVDGIEPGMPGAGTVTAHGVARASLGQHPRAGLPHEPFKPQGAPDRWFTPCCRGWAALSGLMALGAREPGALPRAGMRLPRWGAEPSNGRMLGTMPSRRRVPR